MKKTTTKGALFTSAIALLLCFVMLLGTTFAWFTDEVTSTNNRIQAGTLKIDMLVKGPKDDNSFVKDTEGYWSVKTNPSPVFDYANWEPGYTEFRNIKVVNEGTLALKYTLCININTKNPADAEDLAKVIDVYYAPSELQFANDRAIVDPSMRLGTLSELLKASNGQLMIDDNMLPSEVDYATVILKMQESAGNEFQGTSIGSTFDLNLFATQYTYEGDSFDDQYDKDAYFPVVATMDELLSAINNGDDVSLGTNFTFDEPLKVTADTTIDLAGYTLTLDNQVAGGLEVADGATLTLMGGTVDAKADNISQAISVTNTKAGTKTQLVLKDINVDLAAPDYDNETTNAIYAEAQEGEVEVVIGEGAVVESTEATHHSAIYVGKNATVTLDGGIIDIKNIDNAGGWTSVWGVFLSDDTAKFVMNDGTINVNGDHSTTGIYVDYCAADVEINGGTINVETTSGYGIGIEGYRNQTTNEGCTITVNGGTFNVKATAGTAGEALDVGKECVVNLDAAAVINVYDGLWSGNKAYDLRGTVNGAATINTGLN